MVPGGLYEDMDATRFWVEPGVTSALEDAGFDVLVVHRRCRPATWVEEGSTLARQIRSSRRMSVTVVAGSNGCSAAVRLAIDYAGLVTRLVLCWPATTNDVRVDGPVRELIERETSPDVADALLQGATLRGVTDDELQELNLPVTVIPSEPENPFHRRTTVDALDRLLPDVLIADGSPESLLPEFQTARSRFLGTLEAALTSRSN